VCLLGFVSFWRLCVVVVVGCARTNACTAPSWVDFMEQLSDGLVTGGLVANEWVRDSWRLFVLHSSCPIPSHVRVCESVLVHLKWER
jgi:hypothetical protein